MPSRDDFIKGNNIILKRNIELMKMGVLGF